jgi:hypothetical protein
MARRATFVHYSRLMHRASHDLAAVSLPTIVYRLIRFDHLSQGGDRLRIVLPCQIAATGLGPFFLGLGMYRRKPVAFLAVHWLDSIKKAVEDEARKSYINF